VPKEPEDHRTKEEKEFALLFSFQDPRLQHLKVNYTRESLQPERLSFVHNEQAYRAALDELIKYNQYVNEFNYLQEFASRMRQRLVVEDTKVNGFDQLFQKYDTDGDNLLRTQDLKAMMIDAGMGMVTHSEAEFVFKVIAKFKPTLNLQTFLNWTGSMQGLGQKRLVQYT